MSALVAVGGIALASDAIQSAGAQLDAHCREVGFPDRQEFKWSPGRKLWMRDNLVGSARREFFSQVSKILAAQGATAFAVVIECDAKAMHSGTEPEMDALLTLLERFHSWLPAGEEGVVVVDTPSGDRSDEHGFLQNCVERLATGTPYVDFDQLALPVLSAPSRMVRLLQCADLITSCLAALIAGEENHAPITAGELLPLVRREYGRVGGVGIKIHPDYKYANLYHWLFGDEHLGPAHGGAPLPLSSRKYSKDPKRP